MHKLVKKRRQCHSLCTVRYKKRILIVIKCISLIKMYKPHKGNEKRLKQCDHSYYASVILYYTFFL